MMTWSCQGPQVSKTCSDSESTRNSHVHVSKAQTPPTCPELVKSKRMAAVKSLQFQLVWVWVWGCLPAWPEAMERSVERWLHPGHVHLQERTRVYVVSCSGSTSHQLDSQVCLKVNVDICRASGAVVLAG